MPFSGTPQEILGAIKAIRDGFEEEHKEVPKPDRPDHPDDHCVIIVWEKPDDGEGFVSQRPLLSTPNFVKAVSKLLVDMEAVDAK
jgi:hypothetical protein